MVETRRHRVRDSHAWPLPQFKNCPQDPQQHHVIVIGAGIGGLTAAALLANRGYKVLVVESHYQPGGNCTSWTRSVRVRGDKKTFVFDAGVQDISGLGPKGSLTNLLTQLEATDHIAWGRVRHAYWQDGLFLKGALSLTDFIANIAKVFPSEAKATARFFTEMEAVYREMFADVDATGGIPTPPTSPSALLAWPEKHPHAARWMKQPYETMLNAYLTDNTLKKLLSTLSEYITDLPQGLNVEDMAPLFGYYFDGGHYPFGGAGRLADVLAEKITEHGGRILLKTKVEKILLEDAQVCGVTTSAGTSHFAPIIIANGDIGSMLTELLTENTLPDAYTRKIAALKRGPSAILLSLGLATRVDLPARIFVRQNNLEFGLGNPSVIDPSLAPPGHSSVTALCLLSEEKAMSWHTYDKEEYALQKDAFAERLLQAIEDSVIPDVRRHIVYKEVATPTTFRGFTGAINGNIYGAARSGWRPDLQSPVPGLLLVGAGTQTGAGIEAVVISGTRAANLITNAQIKARWPISFPA